MDKRTSQAPTSGVCQSSFVERDSGWGMTTRSASVVKQLVICSWSGSIERWWRGMYIQGEKSMGILLGPFNREGIPAGSPFG